MTVTQESTTKRPHLKPTFTLSTSILARSSVSSCNLRQPDGGCAGVIFADAHGVKAASLHVWLGDHRVLEVHEPQGGGW